MVYLTVSMPLNLGRLAGYDVSAAIKAIWYLVATLGLLGALFALHALQLKNFKLLMLQFAFLVYAFVLGAFINGPLEAMAGAGYYMLSVCVLLALTRTSDAVDFLLSRRFWVFQFFVHLVSFVTYWYYLRGTIYPGVAVQSLAYCTVALAFFRLRFLVFILLLIGVLEGKRSVLLSQFAGLGFYYLTPYLSRLGRSAWVVAGLVFAMVGWLLLIGMASFESEGTLIRYNQVNPFSASFDPIIGSSGRAGELISLLDSFSLTELLIGLGLGYSYEWELGYFSEQAGESKGYLHISIGNYLASAGIFGMLLCGYFLAQSVSRLNALLLVGDLERFVGAFFLISIVQSFFGFTAAVDPMFWVSVALLWGWSQQTVFNSRAKKRV